MTFEATALILAWVAILLMGLTISGLVRQVHRLQSGRASGPITIGPEVGSAAPPLDGQTEPFTQSRLLMFVDHSCSVCQDILQDLDAASKENAWQDRVTVVYRGESNGHRLANVKVVSNQATAFQDYRVPLTPFAVVVSPEGRIAHSTPVGSTSVLDDVLGVLAKGASHESAHH